MDIYKLGYKTQEAPPLVSWVLYCLNDSDRSYSVFITMQDAKKLPA